MRNNFTNEIYRSLKTFSYFAIVGLALVCLAEIFSVILGLGQIISPTSMLNGSQPLWISLQAVVALLELPCQIFTVVFFLIWLNRANKNLTPLRANNIEFSSGWAVGWWFIPFANLVKPFQIVKEVWNESDPDFNPDVNFLSSSSGTPSILTFWWALWIISNIATNISSRMFDVKTQGDLEITGYVFIVSGILTFIAAILAIKVVYEITNKQDARFLRVNTFKQPFHFQEPPPPPTFNQTY
jgi:Domain of unknown function (DUF4328)